jgi:hypothetical protein
VFGRHLTLVGGVTKLNRQFDSKTPLNPAAEAWLVPALNRLNRVSPQGPDVR